MTKYRYWVFAALLGSLSGCGGHEDDGAATGEEKGHCYPNGTCNAGLSCFSNVCVRYPVSSGSGGGSVEAPGTAGGSNTTGASGAMGNGGENGTAEAGVRRDASSDSSSTVERDADASVAIEVGVIDVEGIDSAAVVDVDRADANNTPDVQTVPDATSTSCGPNETIIMGCGYNPGTTAHAYSGQVWLHITGLLQTGPTNGAEDAFYYTLADVAIEVDLCPSCFRYNRANEGGCVCNVECAATSHRVSDLLVGNYPSFSGRHDYTVLMDLGNGPAEKLNFGMDDCSCADNGGNLTVTIWPDTGVCVP